MILITDLSYLSAFFCHQELPAKRRWDNVGQEMAEFYPQQSTIFSCRFHKKRLNNNYQKWIDRLIMDNLAKCPLMVWNIAETPFSFTLKETVNTLHHPLNPFLFKTRLPLASWTRSCAIFIFNFNMVWNFFFLFHILTDEGLLELPGYHHVFVGRAERHLAHGTQSGSSPNFLNNSYAELHRPLGPNWSRDSK